MTEDQSIRLNGLMSLKKLSFFFLCLTAFSVHAEEASYGISGNPGAVNVETGTGQLGKFFKIPEKSGVRLG